MKDKSAVPSLSRRTRVSTALAIGALLAPDANLRADWPTLHRDNQRSGHSEEVLAGPFERKWWRDFHHEMIASRCEAIVAERMVFVGTVAGYLHALDHATGETVWTFKAAGRIGTSPCYHDGRLFFGSDDGFDHGTLYCLSAATGELRWSHRTPGGIWATPACDGERLYAGDRSGVFHALSIDAGESAWTMRTGRMILTPASLDTEGTRIVFGSEDMHVYCLSPEGALLWKTPKLPGLSLRDHGPTIWQDLAIVRTNPADGFHTVLDRNGETLEAIQRAIPMNDQDMVLLDKWGDLLMTPTPRRQQAEIEGVIDYLRNNRHDQCFFAFQLRDGSEPWIAPVLYTGGLHNPPTPPAFNPASGELYSLSRSALTHYVRGVRRYSCLVRLDRETGRPVWQWPQRDEPNWGRFPMIPDETQALGMMGNLVVGTHQGELAALDPITGAVTSISPTRDTYAGIFGPGALPGSFEAAAQLARDGYLTGVPNEWHGPDRGVVSIADGRLFWIAGSQVVCLAGPDKRQSGSGGAKPPAPFKARLPGVVLGGNVASHGAGHLDASVPPKTIGPADLATFLAPPPAAREPSRRQAAHLRHRLRERLDAEVLELLRGSDDLGWAPFIVQLGIGREERSFWRTAETIQIVSLALPHLSPPVRETATAYLDKLWQDGCPLNTPVHAPAGARREPFELGPKMREFAARAPRYQAQIDDLYALWAYAHHAGRWEPVLRTQASIREIFDRFARNLPPFDPADMERDASQLLNRQIAGTIAAVRLFDQANDQDRADRARRCLAELVTRRVHHERSDSRLVRPTTGESGAIHKARVPRYLDLVPELAAILRAFAGEELHRNVDALRTALPLWGQAYGERMIGGENYISPPHLSRAVYMIWSDGCHAAPEDLAANLDQPWCHADLHYIEKLAATLRRIE